LKEEPPTMSPSINGLVKALFHLTWADGVVSPEEVRTLTSIFRRLGFPLSEVICLLDENLSKPPTDTSPVQLDLLFPDQASRTAALEMLMTVCFSEGAIQPEQVGYIEGLVIRMGLDYNDLEQLRQKAMAARAQ
jgi:hypothetical protein